MSTSMKDGAVASSSMHSSPHRKRQLQHSFHVLTDGSEFTGHGCVFLTVYPSATSTIRYALSGVCEQVSRLAADQKFPLHHTRAVFVSSLQCSLDGLASLLLTLQQAGASQLTVVGANGTCHAVDGVVETVLSQKTTHPRVYTCEIDSLSQQWFLVYQDEYLVVHAKSVGSGNVMLVYTVSVDETTKSSFAILPSQCGNVSIVSPLPEYVGSEPLDFVLLLNATASRVSPEKKIARWFLQTAPRNDLLDDGLLIRAQYLAQQRHAECLFLYPYNNDTNQNDSIGKENVVMTCSTWRLGDYKVDRDSYKQDIWERCRRGQDEEEKNGNEEKCVKAHSRDAFYGTTADTNTDENEIDLDDDENDVDDILTVPHLLVLGTGCASPSPQRGSSGYALFLPHLRENKVQLRVVIECGEGFVFSLRRHLPAGMNLDEQLQHLQLIWISHAHLDHYGGLPSLLRAIHCASSKVKQQDTSEHKRQRCSPPIVVAPRKVLHYLQVMLPIAKQLFEGMTHKEWEVQELQRLPYMPFEALQSVAVEHCPDAHALLLVWRGGGYSNDNVLLCYSGDCRPSLNLIHAAHRQRNEAKLTLLLHEATFDDEDATLARSKRHSTVSEALWVAGEIKPDATLLTHFSQRYPKAAPRCSNNNGSNAKLNYGVCEDGLWLPLTQKAMSNVHLLK